jgi:hypothetical protein
MLRLRFFQLGAATVLAAAMVTGSQVLDSRAANAPTPSSLNPIVACRLADTRSGTDRVGSRGTLGPADTATFAVWGANGQCSIPSGATGIVANVTVVNATAASFLTTFPADAARPTTASLNWPGSGPPLGNEVTMALSASGAFDAYNYAGTVDVVIDVVGYYTATEAGPFGPTGARGAAGPSGPKGEGSAQFTIPTALGSGDPRYVTAPFVVPPGVSSCVVTSTVQTTPPPGAPNGQVAMWNVVFRDDVIHYDDEMAQYLYNDGVGTVQSPMTRSSVLAVAPGETVKFAVRFTGFGNTDWRGVSYTAVMTYVCS